MAFFLFLILLAQSVGFAVLPYIHQPDEKGTIRYERVYTRNTIYWTWAFIIAEWVFFFLLLVF